MKVPVHPMKYFKTAACYVMLVLIVALTVITTRQADHVFEMSNIILIQAREHMEETARLTITIKRNDQPAPRTAALPQFRLTLPSPESLKELEEDAQFEKDFRKAQESLRMLKELEQNMRRLEESTRDLKDNLEKARQIPLGPDWA